MKLLPRNFLFLLLLCTAQIARAQAPDRPTSGQVYADIEKLGILGSALYLAAHPDDENTRLIAYLANVEKVETAYLSLTRGDGGQNLIAPDIRELLGLTRTQELLAARRIDGGTQFFSRANDFGYSKHPDETFNIWDKEQVLADAVWVIRNWRPDVIVLRFDPRAPGTTHGHHTASAMIGMEAFDLAGDPRAFPEQLEHVKPWQARRIYWNAYTWRGVPEHMDTTKIIRVDGNVFLPVLGESTGEIAARSRSQHKSQGFGSAGSRGEQIEQLELLKGDDRDEDGRVFAGIDVSWNRIPGGAAIGQAIREVQATYDFSDPSASIPALMDVYELIKALRPANDDAKFWRDKKAGELREVIAGALGLYLAGRAEVGYVTAGDSLELELEVANRSDIPVRLNKYTILQNGTALIDSTQSERRLAGTEVFEEEVGIEVRPTGMSSGPYWLQSAGTLGMYAVENQAAIGQGETPDPITATFELGIPNGRGEQVLMSFERPVRHVFTDPVKGEQHQPLDITPPVFAELDESSYLFTGTSSQVIRVKVTGAKADLAGTVELCTPSGWQVSPENYPLQLGRKGQEAFFTFELTPPAGQAQGTIVPMVKLDGAEEGYTRKLTKIDHAHLPTQLADMDASAPVAKLDLKTVGGNIGYLPGAGDAIPEALTNIGYRVSMLGPTDLTTGDLSRYDAIVVGIRAYNVEENIANYQPRLLDYVEGGGTVVVQYNTTRGLKMDQEEIGPYPLKLSRDRVTVEEAEVRILAPDHRVLNHPNKITSQDFDGWVQERGLYFPNEWSEEYTPILSSNDPGEDAHDGGLLVAEYGDGYFVYTGYSFFRELPAGVPGAYRLFTNLISLSSDTRP